MNADDPKRAAHSSPGEREVFEREMSDARRLEPTRPVPAQRAPRARSANDHEREIMAELDALVSGRDAAAAEFDDTLLDPEDVHEGAVPGVNPRTLRQLRRGEYAIQAHLDLHGRGAEDARGLVENFVCDAHARGLRCIRIVHGRGLNSPGGIPVLKKSLPRWLARGPARRLILAYTSAPPTDGGTGATYLLLRRNGPRPTPP